MQLIDLINKVLVVLPLAYQGQNVTLGTGGAVTNAPAAGNEWSYDDIPAWGNVSPTCNNGGRQSPIELSTRSSPISQLLPLRFINYDVPLMNNLMLVNTGHTVEMEIPRTINGGAPAITSDILRDRYEALNVHFHWGAPGVLGSEHSINNCRYDVEMHIVHRNSRYATTEEALRYPDGLVVLGIMLKIVNDPDRIYPGLNMIFNAIPQVTLFNSSTLINGPITAGQLLGDLSTKRFFTYRGSLTTPPCAEALTWFVFPSPLPIAYAQISNFFNLRNQNGDYLLENYRPLQARNMRQTLYRIGPFDPFLLPFTQFYKSISL